MPLHGCMRWALPHLSKHCDTPTFRRCINCGGNHSANCRSCPVYKKELQWRKPKGLLPPPWQPVADSRPVTGQPGPSPPATAAVTVTIISKTKKQKNKRPNQPPVTQATPPQAPSKAPAPPKAKKRRNSALPNSEMSQPVSYTHL